MGLTAAHERVRVARALDALPVTAEGFGAGRLSWTQVRTITRVATGNDEASWVELARNATGAQLERLVRGVRRAQRTEEDAADPEQAAWRNEARVSYDEDGTLMISVRLPAEQGAAVLAALEQARSVLDHATKPAVKDLSRLVAHLNPLSGWARLGDGELLPPSSLTALETPAVRLRPLTPAVLTRHDLGRTQRLPSLVLRELLGTVNGQRCRFPGCTRHHTLHAHHVQLWSNNGATDLANLLLLCSRHHTLVHAHGFQLQLHPDLGYAVAVLLQQAA